MTATDTAAQRDAKELRDIANALDDAGVGYYTSEDVMPTPLNGVRVALARVQELEAALAQIKNLDCHWGTSRGGTPCHSPSICPACIADAALSAGGTTPPPPNSLLLAAQNVDRIYEGLRTDANDGTFALWSEDDLVAALHQLGNVLRGGAVAPQVEDTPASEQETP